MSLFLENHVEGVTFQPHEAGNTVEVRVDAGEPAPDESHFFVAVCAHRPQMGNPTFVYVPRAANVLRERERHILLLEKELATKNEWLDKVQRDLAEFDREHQKLLAMFREQKEALERSNRWAEELNREVTGAARARGGAAGGSGAEQEAARAMAEQYAAKVRDLEEDVRAKTQWARDVETSLKAEVDKQTAELVKAVEALHADGKGTARTHGVGAPVAGGSAPAGRAGSAVPRVALGETGPQGGTGSGCPCQLTWRSGSDYSALKGQFRTASGQTTLPRRRCFCAAVGRAV